MYSNNFISCAHLSCTGTRLIMCSPFPPFPMSSPSKKSSLATKRHSNKIYGNIPRGKNTKQSLCRLSCTPVCQIRMKLPSHKGYESIEEHIIAVSQHFQMQAIKSKKLIKLSCTRSKLCYPHIIFGLFTLLEYYIPFSSFSCRNLFIVACPSILIPFSLKSKASQSHHV